MSDIDASGPIQVDGLDAVIMAYDQLKADADKLAEALESLDQPLCERIIDPCGYDPTKESREDLIISILDLSEENQVSLNVVRQTLKEYRDKYGGGK